MKNKNTIGRNNCYLIIRHKNTERNLTHQELLFKEKICSFVINFNSE